MDLYSPLSYVKGVGETLAKKFAQLGLKTAADLIDYYPRRYDDFSEVQTISSIRPGMVTLRARVGQVRGRYLGGRMHITEAAASDTTGKVKLVWFNQPYRAASLKPSQEYFISGEFGVKRLHMSITNPSVELVQDFPVNTARIIPIYKETKGLKSGQIRKVLRELIPTIQELPETLPQWIIKGQKLVSYAQALETIHFPSSTKALQHARRRLGFEEVFRLTLAALLNKQEVEQEIALPIKFDEKLAKDFVKHLPFRLTDAQRKVTWQVYKDIEQTIPANRLIEGDVGSGKTVVATMAALMALKQGIQVALMAPTELLARQHADTVRKLLEPLGMENNVGLLIGGMTTKEKQMTQKKIASGDVDFMVGTHALIQEKVDMKLLGLILIDEQHRFGVEQRKQLQAKAGHVPHVLTMTATPIPRSLALTLYGEMDISILDEKPTNRLPISTKLLRSSEHEKAYKIIEEQLKQGRQAFVVCPMITGDEENPMKSVEAVHKQLSQGPFKHRRVGLLHGKLKPDEKDAIMQRFVNHEYDLLVSTTVIEVGVDVPNATVMLVENAERFGLAQLHQLRGRVGRSEYEGHCLLMLGEQAEPNRRLRALVVSNDGFKLAELDLEIRGPGAIYGTMQHGELDLRVAKLTDTKLIATARACAQEFINRQENLLKYKELNKRVQKLRAVVNLN